MRNRFLADPSFWQQAAEEHAVVRLALSSKRLLQPSAV